MDASDIPGKRVLVKSDSAPGQNNENFLPMIWLIGTVLYPGVPNTTSVSQETGKNYGLFKYLY